MSFRRILFIISIFISIPLILKSQEEAPCGKTDNKKVIKKFDKAVDLYSSTSYSEAIKILKEITEDEPEYADPYFLLGMIYIKKADKNIISAKKYFSRVIEICPEYDPYTYYYLGDIYYGAEKYDTAALYFKNFLKDVDKIKSDKDYKDAQDKHKWAMFYDNMYKHPVPFEPKVLDGVCTPLDEFLPYITADNDYCYYTRRTELPMLKSAISLADKKYKEKFMVSERRNGVFDQGTEMPPPFNISENEGGVSMTADNKFLVYTKCKEIDGGNYYNCDLCYSEYINNVWTSIKNLDNNVNTSKTWETQPSITADGKTIYFVSDRPGGYGGSDIYKTIKDDSGRWSKPINLGPSVNTAGNEKTPFIHTDSQTLYFASDGWPGMGGYDIYYIKLGDEYKWTKPKNIGYPINSKDDDIGFFVSTDGKFAYFASNKIKGVGGYDIFYFDLYEEARPEKVLFLKGELKDEKTDQPIRAKLELTNIETKKVTQIPVDEQTGKYIAVMPFKNDYLLTIKKDDYAYESKYISKEDETFQQPTTVELKIKPIEVGGSYQLKDINFATNSYVLNKESMLIIDGFIQFLKENERIKVEIQGHTDNVGNEKANQVLSENRAKSVEEYMIQQGLSPLRLKYKGYGASKPIASNQTDVGKAKNRRTVFVIIAK
ncbi:MAG: OmpA family protein [Bacteroidota bacterium]